MRLFLLKTKLCKMDETSGKLSMLLILRYVVSLTS